MSKNKPGRIARLGSFIRKAVRFAAGILFWLNALFVLTVPRPPLQSFAARFDLDVSEMLLILFFAFMAILNSYSFWRFAVDVFYIYGFPFVLSFHLVRIFIKWIMRLRRWTNKVITLPPATADWIT